MPKSQPGLIDRILRRDKPKPRKTRRSKSRNPMALVTKPPENAKEAFEQALMEEGFNQVRKDKAGFSRIAAATFLSSMGDRGSMASSLALVELQDDPEYQDLIKEREKARIRRQMDAESGDDDEDDADLDRILHGRGTDFTDEVDELVEKMEKLQALQYRLNPGGGNASGGTDWGQIITKVVMPLAMGFLQQMQRPPIAPSPIGVLVDNGQPRLTAPPQPPPSNPITETAAGASLPPPSAVVGTVTEGDPDPVFMGLSLSEALQLSPMPAEQAANQAMVLIRQRAEGMTVEQKQETIDYLNLFLDGDMDQCVNVLNLAKSNVPEWQPVLDFMIGNVAWLTTFREVLQKHFFVGGDEEEEEEADEDEGFI